MAESPKYSAKFGIIELTSILFPSAFSQTIFPLLVLVIVCLHYQLKEIAYIVIFYIFALITHGLLKNKWIFFTGKQSRDIMRDGTGGSNTKPLIQDATYVTKKEAKKLKRGSQS